MLAFTAGTALFDVANLSVRGRAGPRESRESDDVKKVLRRGVHVFSLVGIAGGALRLADLFVIKRYLDFESTTEFRIRYSEVDLYQEGAAALLSIASALLLPFCVSAVLAAIYVGLNQLPTHQKILTGLAGSMYLLYYVLRGARLPQLVLLSLAGLAYALRSGDHSYRRLMSSRALAIGLIAGAAFLYYVATVFSNRIEVQGLTVVSAVDYMRRVHNVEASGYLTTLASGKGLTASAAYLVISLFHYIQHGIVELSQLISWMDGNNIAPVGIREFYPVYKAAEVAGIGDASVGTLANYVHKPGVYTTFFGPLLVDFREFSVPFMVAVGYLSQWGWSQLQRGGAEGLLIYPYIATVIAFTPIVNLIETGSGLYLIFGLSMSALYVLSIRSHPSR